jgi:flagellin
MGLSIYTNPAAMAANNALQISNKSLSTSMERLGTGKRINSAADDAAGLQIATRMQSQSNGMDVAMRNVSGATAMLKTAEGAFDEMTNVLYRMKDLATQAANGTNSTDDLAAMQAEYDQLGQEMNTMMNNTTYAGETLLGVSGTLGATGGVVFQIGAGSADTMTVDLSAQMTALDTQLGTVSAAYTASGTATPGTEISTASGANAMIDQLDAALSAVSSVQSTLGASINRLGHTSANLQNMKDNTDVAIGNIMDTDYASEVSNMTREQVLTQTSMTMLKQSNSMSSMVLSLLQ